MDGVRAYLVGAALYLPEEWLTDAARAQARIPASVEFRQRWRLALTLLRQVRASGIKVTGVLADAEFGDTRMFRAMLHRLRIPYAVGVSSHLTAFIGTPPLEPPGAGRRRRKRPRPAAGFVARPIADLIATGRPPWRRIHWRNVQGGRRWTADCVALRVTPAIDHRHPRLPPELWLLAERDVGSKSKTRFYYVNLPATAVLPEIVRLAHQRWAIEQQYQELKSELGLDHFEGRTFPGWHHHVVLTAVAYNFLQSERGRAVTRLTFSMVHGIVQEIFTAYLFARRPHYLRRIQELQSVQLRI